MIELRDPDLCYVCGCSQRRIGGSRLYCPRHTREMQEGIEHTVYPAVTFRPEDVGQAGAGIFNEPLIPADELALWKESEKAALRRVVAENERLRHETAAMRRVSSQRAEEVRAARRSVAELRAWVEEKRRLHRPERFRDSWDDACDHAYSLVLGELDRLTEPSPAAPADDAKPEAGRTP